MDQMEPSVFAWPAAFFILSDHKWEYGELQVTPSTLRFYNVTSNSSAVSTPEKQAKCLLQTINFDNITEIKKASSSYVFKCLVILCKDGVTHWFGSFPGRDGAYSTLLHFWKERLVPQGGGSASPGQSMMGRELLKIAQESRDTLQVTGSALRRQGEQLEYAQSVMNDIHCDLDVADRLTDNLESWFGHWGVSSHSLISAEPVELIDARGVPIIHEIPILYQTSSAQTTQLQGGPSLLSKIHLSPKRVQAIHQHNGALRLSSEEVTVVDSNQHPVYHYKSGEISAVNVISPWKLSIVRYCIGEPDIVCRITSTRLVQVLPVLHSIIPDKIQYDSLMGQPVEHAVWPGTATNTVPPTSPQFPTDHDLPEPGTSNVTTAEVYQPGRAQFQVKTTTAVSESEVSQLKDLIGEMKAVALDIQVEQDRQLETIEHLTGSVDMANDRLKSTTGRVNQLI